MKKNLEPIVAIIRRILYIGFGIQIVLGTVWMCFNFTHLQRFDVTGGGLYRLVEPMLTGVYPLTYFLQLAAAGFAAYLLMKTVFRGEMGKAVFGTAALLTFPLAMQCHLSISPYSFASSLVILELLFLWEGLESDTQVVRSTVKAAAMWLLLYGLLSEYSLLGLFPIILFVFLKLRYLCRNVASLCRTLIVILAFGGMVTGMGELTQASNPYSKENVVYSIFFRTSWPSVWYDNHVWPDEVKEVFGDGSMELIYRVGKMETFFRPTLETELSVPKAQAFYKDMTNFSWIMHKRMVLQRIGTDLLGYTVSPIGLQLQLEGKGENSFAGRNYELFINISPLIGKRFMDYSCWWFDIMLILALAGRIVRSVINSNFFWKGLSIKKYLLCLIWFGVVIVAYTMRGTGLQDYKCTIAMNLMWSVYALGLLRKDA